MVDVVLVLLVIMMVSATYIVSQSLKVELPKTASSDESVSTVAAVTVDEGRRVLLQPASPCRATPPHGRNSRRRAARRAETSTSS